MEITLQNFQTDVIQASMAQPILLDIWAPWCGPCKVLGPVLEAVELNYGGRFQLAKVNADEQPDIAGQLSKMFGVRSIPFCVLFKDGQPVDGFVGALPQAQIEEFLDKHLPSLDTLVAADEAASASELLSQGHPEDALRKLQIAVDTDPENDAIRFNYLRALLTMNQVAAARTAFEPVASKVAFDSKLAAISHWLVACEKYATAPTGSMQDNFQAAIAANKRDFEARFALAQIHLAAQRFTQSLDELLEIIQRDKAWGEQSPRKLCVAILELMAKPVSSKPAAAQAPKGTLELAGTIETLPNDPMVDQYRRRLSMALF
jgi:putative thioredoxin